MASRMLVGSKPMRVVLGAGGGLRFSPKASGFNRCVGGALRGGRHPGTGVATRQNSKGQAFAAAARSCR